MKQELKKLARNNSIFYLNEFTTYNVIRELSAKIIKIRFLLCVLLIIILSDNVLVAQNDTTLFNNRVNVEIGGQAGHYSVNFEKILFAKKKKFLSAAIGFSPTLIAGTPEKYSLFTPRICAQVKYNLKFNKNYIGVGLALTNYYWINKPLILKSGGIHFALFPIMGCSRDISDRLNLGVSFTPLVYDQAIDFMPWGAIRLGYRLK